MQAAHPGFGGCEGFVGRAEKQRQVLAVSLGQQAALCGDTVCLQRAKRGQRGRAGATVLNSAVLSREETRPQEQWPAGPKRIKNNAIELVGNTPMVGVHEKGASFRLMHSTIKSSCRHSGAWHSQLMTFLKQIVICKTIRLHATPHGVRCIGWVKNGNLLTAAWHTELQMDLATFACWGSAFQLNISGAAGTAGVPEQGQQRMQGQDCVQAGAYAAML